MSHFLSWMESRMGKVDFAASSAPPPRSVCRSERLLPLIAVALINVSHQGALEKEHKAWKVNANWVRQTTSCSPACSATVDPYRLMLPQHGRFLHWSLSNAWVTVVTHTDNPAHSLMLHLSALASRKKKSLWKNYKQFQGRESCNWCPFWYHKGPIQQRWNRVVIIQFQTLALCDLAPQLMACMLVKLWFNLWNCIFQNAKTEADSD